MNLHHLSKRRDISSFRRPHATSHPEVEFKWRLFEVEGYGREVKGLGARRQDPYRGGQGRWARSQGVRPGVGWAW